MRLRCGPPERTFSRTGYPFVVTDGLIYNIQNDGTRSLCVPYVMIKHILEAVHDGKHHFGRDKMLYELRKIGKRN